MFEFDHEVGANVAVQMPVDEQVPNAIAVMDEDERYIMDLTAKRSVQYCSFKPETEDDEIVLFNAMNNPTKRLGDCINMTISVRHVFCEIVDCTNRETGVTTKCPRIVLIGDDGESYQAVSIGIFSALKKIFSIKGEPTTWKKPVHLKVLQQSRGDRKMLTFEMVK